MPKEEDVVRRTMETLERRELEHTVRDGLRTIFFIFRFAPSDSGHIGIVTDEQYERRNEL